MQTVVMKLINWCLWFFLVLFQAAFAKLWAWHICTATFAISESYLTWFYNFPQLRWRRNRAIRFKSLYLVLTQRLHHHMVLNIVFRVIQRTKSYSISKWSDWYELILHRLSDWVMHLFQGVHATLQSGRWLWQDFTHLRLILIAANIQTGFKLDRNWLIFHRMLRKPHMEILLSWLVLFAQIRTIILRTNPFCLWVLKNHIKLFLVQLEAGNVWLGLNSLSRLVFVSQNCNITPVLEAVTIIAFWVRLKRLLNLLNKLVLFSFCVTFRKILFIEEMSILVNLFNLCLLLINSKPLFDDFLSL